MPHTTVPQDPGLTFDPTGRFHLVVAAPCGPEVDAVLAAADMHAALLCVGPPPAGAPADTVVADDTDAVLGALRERLATATVGVRLYVAGDEGFLRRAGQLAFAAGMRRDELRTEITAQPARRVYCVHCRAITDGVTQTVAPCSGCARTLTVYHHFSRRQAAYLGFMADAEAPGEVPEPEPIPWP